MTQRSNADADRKAAAERFFRGVYGGDPTVVDDLASEHVIISYPVFETVLGKPAIRGRKDVKAFVIAFSQRWADPQIAIHEAIAEGNTVVLLWSYQARRVETGGNDQPVTGTEHSWGGITLFHFDEDGKIAVELGEESSPGPVHRSGLGGGSRRP